MPIHDWSRVDANLFHDFHQAWSVAIRTALNAGLLPKGYSALVENADQSQASPNRITIQRPLGRRVSAIEILSPRDKLTQRSLQAMVDQIVRLVRQGIHVLVIDLFVPSLRAPANIHHAIWSELNGGPFTPSTGKPLSLVAYISKSSIEAHVKLVALGDELPSMPAFLDVQRYIQVPLEATYQATWASCPENMRALVEGEQRA
jgi:hypothetical protein